MTNKDYMAQLDVEHFEQAMHTLYFEPKLWVQGSEVKKRSTPNMFEVRSWLTSLYDPNSAFWAYVLGEENVPQHSSNVSKNKDTPFCDGCHAAEICYGVDVEHCEGYKYRAKQAIVLNTLS